MLGNSLVALSTICVIYLLLLRQQIAAEVAPHYRSEKMDSNQIINLYSERPMTVKYGLRAIAFQAPYACGSNASDSLTNDPTREMGRQAQLSAI